MIFGGIKIFFLTTLLFLYEKCTILNIHNEFCKNSLENEEFMSFSKNIDLLYFYKIYLFPIKFSNYGSFVSFFGKKKSKTLKWCKPEVSSIISYMYFYHL